MAIPIIGQPSVGEDWFIVIPLKCSCGAHMNIAGQIGVVRGCPNPECRYIYRVMKMPDQTPDGQINWFIGTAMRPPT